MSYTYDRDKRPTMNIIKELEALLNDATYHPQLGYVVPAMILRALVYAHKSIPHDYSETNQTPPITEQAKSGDAIGKVFREHLGGANYRYYGHIHSDNVKVGDDLFTSPQPTPSDVKDAERWRWICNHANVIKHDAIPKTGGNKQFLNNTDWLNYVIDAAMSKECTNE